MILSDSVYESQGWKKIMIFSKLKIRFFNLNQIFFLNLDPIFLKSEFSYFSMILKTFK